MLSAAMFFNAISPRCWIDTVVWYSPMPVTCASAQYRSDRPWAFARDGGAHHDIDATQFCDDKLILRVLVCKVAQRAEAYDEAGDLEDQQATVKRGH